MKKSDEGKARAPRDMFEEFEPSPDPPPGPDGAPAMHAIGQSAPPPDISPANMQCLRGPCRHYWELRTHVDAGNAPGTFGPGGLRVVDAVKVDDDGNVNLEYGDGFVKEPRQINRVCLVNQGFETELTGDCVYDCSRWDPEDSDAPDVLAREVRRKRYLAQHPEFSELTDDELEGIDDDDE